MIVLYFLSYFFFFNHSFIWVCPRLENQTQIDIKKDLDGRLPTWESAQMGDRPHGRGSLMGKWAHIAKMNPYGKKRTEFEKMTPDGKKYLSAVRILSYPR